MQLWLFGRNEQADPKTNMEMQDTQNSQNNLEKEQSFEVSKFKTQ